MNEPDRLEEPSRQQIEGLMQAARTAVENAYAPYSRFCVGAALLCDDGSIYSGANVENAAYGLSMCAERSALFSAVSAGRRHFIALAIFTPTADPTPPCGACRQALNEFAPNAHVFSLCNSNEVRHEKLSRLLPGAFGPANLTT